MLCPKISVIVPAYNVEDYISDCLDSILNQSYQNLEIIVVDDSSTDHTGKIIDNYAKRNSEIIAIHKKHGGLSDSRNVGMQAAHGTYIGFVDSDDVISPYMYEIMLNAMLKEKSDLVFCSFERFSGDITKKLDTSKSFYQIQNYSSEQILKKLLLNELADEVWKGLYKKDLVIDIPFEYGKIHEDVFWMYQAVAQANTVTMLSAKLYGYRMRSESIMHQPFTLQRLDELEARHQRLLFFKSHYPALINLAIADLLSRCMNYWSLSSTLSWEDHQTAKTLIRSYVKDCSFHILNFIKEPFISIGRKLLCILSKTSFTGVCTIKALCLQIYNTVYIQLFKKFL